MKFDDQPGDLEATTVTTDSAGHYSLQWPFPFDTTGSIELDLGHTGSLAAQQVVGVGAAQPGNGCVLPLIADPADAQSNDKYLASPNSTSVNWQIDAYCLPFATLESDYAQGEADAASAGASPSADAKTFMTSSAG